MPFVHLEREIWDLRDGSGAEIGPDAPERGPWLAGREAVGRLRPGLEQLLADPGTLVAAARLLLNLHFTPGLAVMICDAVGLDLAVLELAANPAVAAARRSLRRPGFAEDVLRAYAYQCAMCGFDGALGRNPVGLEAAHVRWHSQDGPDVIANGLALCALHDALFDLGVLGLTADLRIRVSSLYVARSDAGRRAVTLPGCTGQDGMPRWFGGGRLHGTLTLPRLRESWARAHGAAERSGASRLTGPERTEIYRHAARQAAIATEHLRRCTATDPERGGDAAWAVADALRVAARATGSRALRCVADTYDRASRSPYGRIARRTPEGSQLRAAVRLLAMTGGTTGDGMGQAGALAANLVALIDAVAGLRQAQAHAAQAAAARTAAEQLHAALTAARAHVTHPGQTLARSARHAAAAAEFPLPLADVLAAAVFTDSAEQRSKP